MTRHANLALSSPNGDRRKSFSDYVAFAMQCLSPVVDDEAYLDYVYACHVRLQTPAALREVLACCTSPHSLRAGRKEIYHQSISPGTSVLPHIHSIISFCL